jgi:hypothetical protein
MVVTSLEKFIDFPLLSMKAAIHIYKSSNHNRILFMELNSFTRKYSAYIFVVG